MLSILKILYLNITIVNAAFFNPLIKLDSGKSISIIGKGPPLLFPRDLFKSMSVSCYNNFINELSRTATVISSDGSTPLVENDIEDIVKTLQVDKITYLSHPSFFPDVLNSQYINSAVLLDPINVSGIGEKSKKKLLLEIIN